MNEKTNGSVPPWLAELGIKPGGFFTDSKLRAKRAMKSGCFSGAARVHICLGLHTMGYQQERAVKMEAGKQVPLTPTDIAAETGLKKQNIRRILEDLEAAGLAAVEGSTKGRILIYAWAVPRAPKLPPKPVENGNQIDYHFGDSSNGINKLEAVKLLKPLFARFRIQLSDDMVITHDYLSAVGAALRDYQKAQMVLKEALNGNQPPERINKEERNERNIERNGGVPPPPPLPSVVEKADEDEPPTSTDVALRIPAPPTFEDFKTLYPPQALDAPKAKPLFDAKSPPEKAKCIERLLVYRQSLRWVQDPQYVPLASTWLRSAYEEPPPPLMDFAAQKENGKAAEKGRQIERVAALAKAMGRRT